MEATTKASTEQIEQEIQELLDQEVFESPPEFVEKTLISDESVYDEAAGDPVAWWEKQAEALHWFDRWDTALDESNAPFYKWFSGGKLNASYNCLDRHIEDGKGDKVAFHWRGEEGEERDITYADLHRDTQKLANALKDRGISKGDVVGIYLPMIPEVVVAMLACARIGAPHNVVFGGFSPDAVKERMEFAQAKALVTVDGARRKGKTAPIKSAVDEKIGDVDSLETIFVVKATDADCDMTMGRDVWYHEALAAADGRCEPEHLDAEHPLYVLYTSGSTAKPKGVLHTTGGYLLGVALTHKWVFDIKENDIFWCTADVGWVTGHSYIVYGPLANGTTVVMYEGAPNWPEPDRFWKIIEEYRVNILYTAPTAIRAFIRWGDDWVAKHDLSSLRLLGTVGEPINPEAWMWYHKTIGGGRCPIVDTWWQTETGSIMVTPLPGAIPTKPGSATLPFFGVDPAIVDQKGQEVGPNIGGKLIIRRPWPSMLRTIYGDNARYRQQYWSEFKGSYLTGDGARRDKDGYFWIVGRIDDVLNVAGHRLGTSEIESALVSHPRVAEAAVVGRPDELKGQGVVAFVTVKSGVQVSRGLKDELRNHVSKHIGAIAKPDEVRFAEALPKTRSGKIMRRLLKEIASGAKVTGDTTTLEDFSVLANLAAPEE